jgi:hypothetical protein
MMLFGFDGHNYALTFRYGEKKNRRRVSRTTTCTIYIDPPPKGEKLEQAHVLCSATTRTHEDDEFTRFGGRKFALTYALEQLPWMGPEADKAKGFRRAAWSAYWKAVRPAYVKV